MARYLSNRDGGKTNEQGLYQMLDKLFAGEVINGFNVTQQDTPSMGIKVNVDSNGAASVFIPSGNDYPYAAFMDAAENITLATADGSNPRIDLIVAYIDLTVVSSTNSNNPNALIVDNITGTPAGSPAVPNDAAIHAVIGASNPYVILARVAVAAGATTITNANITDVRVFALLPSSSIHNPYKFSVYRNAAFNITNAFAKVQFDTELFDTGGNFDSSSNYRFTAPVAGFYLFSWMIGVPITNTDAVAALYKNGTIYAWGNETSDGGAGGSKLVQAAATDYFEIFVVGSGTLAAGVGVNPVKTYFDGFLVSRT